MANLKMLIVTAEMAPYTELTEQSVFLRDLAIYLQKSGAEIRVFMPKFGNIKERKHRLHEVIRLSGLNITVGRNNNPLIIKVASLQTAKIQIYFLDNEEFFSRKNFYHDANNNYYQDNDERIVFFNKGVFELLLKLGWIPDVIHCQGWMSGLVPLLARTTFKNEPPVRNSKIIYSYFEDDLKFNIGPSLIKKAAIKVTNGDLQYLENPHNTDLNKSGAAFADHFLISSDHVEKETETFFKSLNNGNILDIRDNKPESFYEKYYKLIR